jgi:hypothetical protein
MASCSLRADGCEWTKNGVASMACAKHLRLWQAYRAAVAAWKFNHPTLVNGDYSTEDTSRFRREMLNTRSRAATDLYDHSVKCPKCNMVKSTRDRG